MNSLFDTNNCNSSSGVLPSTFFSGHNASKVYKISMALYPSSQTLPADSTSNPKKFSFRRYLMAKPIEVKSKKRPLAPQTGKARVKSFQAPPPSFFRRLRHWVFNPITFSVTLLFAVAVILTAAYFWFDYSDRIDLLLRGEVFTRSAGVYAAPKLLKDGENISRDDLVKYLKSAGYIEKNQQADAARSRYQLEENAVNIEPGDTAKLDDKINFPTLKVRFAKDGKSVAAIADLSANKEVKQTQLEPKILSSITAEGDGRRKAVTFQDLPPHLVKAITVTEDRAFFEHYGVNFRGILRALWRRYEVDNAAAGQKSFPDAGKIVYAQSRRSLYVGDSGNAPDERGNFHALREPDLSRTAGGRVDLRRRRSVERVFRQRRLAIESGGSGFSRRNYPQPESLQRL
jgi:hypothetical protein